MLGEIKLLGDWSFDRWTGVIAVVVGVIALAFIKEARDGVRNVVRVYWRWGVLGLLTVFICVYGYWRRGVLGLLAAFIACCFVFVVWFVQRYRDWRPYPKEKRGRWE